MEIFIILIILFISGTIIGYKIGNKKPEKIKIPMTIETAPDGMIWGQVNFGDHLLTAYGNNQTELDYRMKQLLFDLEKINPESVEFIIESK
jgi:hypothetical protein